MINNYIEKFKKLTVRGKISFGIKAVNVCLILIMLGCIFKLSTGSKNTANNNVTVTSNSNAVESASQAAEAEKAMNQASGTMAAVYYNLVQGTTATINDYPMSFEYGGKFNGFFDSANSNVKDYTYTVTELSDADAKENNRYVANLNIYNKDMSVSVQYKLIFDDNSNLLLYYPAAKLYIALVE